MQRQDVRASLRLGLRYLILRRVGVHVQLRGLAGVNGRLLLHRVAGVGGRVLLLTRLPSVEGGEALIVGVDDVSDFDKASLGAVILGHGCLLGFGRGMPFSPAGVVHIYRHIGA